MKTHSMKLLLVLFFATLALPASAEWFDDYDKGLDAARAKNWDTVISKMNAAISAKPQAEKKARTYGVNFVNYQPYYYRGVAYLNKQQWANAIEDLKKAAEAGSVNLGDPSTLLITANQQLTAEQIRSVTPAQPPVQRPAEPPKPDPAIAQSREKAETAIKAARTKFNRAQQNNAATNAAQEFDRGSDLLRQATSASIDADSAADHNRVADLAERAGRAFDASVTAAAMRVGQLERDRLAREAEAHRNREATTPVARPRQEPVTPPAKATEAVLSESRVRLKSALESYFEGNFPKAARSLEQLALDQPNNAMIFAFLGASRYYEYYLSGESDIGDLERARQALLQARSLKPSLKLDTQYFSPRLRNFYEALD